ncbi:peptidoglycan DD-metalloendopeptidase family protein [Roseixanthobacter glucoisosaccharinicivorans]|uniref:peptidoglycan DD-metalloendopeptidase family protein n=1 Tax=Roseixanthobacter glucoisosaccharinicivorans TaxID=3119923 RepID=UPI00372AFBF2
MQHRRSAGTWRDATSAVGLGDEPPLGVDGDEEEIDRRRISVRWLAATLLTGLCGSFLMGGAVYAALDGDHRFASLPETVRAAVRGALAAGERPSNAARKGDRMSLLSEASTARQTFRLSVTTKVGDKEIIKVRPFTRVAANLAMSTTSVSTNIPRFNPAQIVSQSVDKEEAAPQAEPTGEVTVVMRDLATAPPHMKFGAAVAMEDVLVKVREVAELARAQPVLAASLPQAITGLGARPGAADGSAPYLAYATEGNYPATAGIGPKVDVPENVSFLGKTSDETSGGNAWSDQTVLVKKGDTIVSILTDNGVSQDEARQAAAAFGRGRDGTVKDGLRVRLLTQDGADKKTHPLRISLFSDAGHEGTVAKADNDKFVQVAEPTETDVGGISEDVDDDDNGPGIRLYDSLYETALRNEVPRNIIADLVRVYSFDVDFQRRVKPGDNFEVLYTEDGGDEEVLFAALSTNGETRRYYRFQTSDDGLVDYYDEDGKSAKKFLVRKPMAGGVMRSPFGYRRHPILGYSKLHTGVDWADAVGTPIFAAGNGTIIYANWKSGYGRHTEIQHANGYVTTYSHQSGFAKGIREGVQVRQGQVIGYLGSSGLSTGPHLHYEVKINGSFVDPMRVKLPRGRALEGRFLAEFKKERERIELLLAHAPVPPKVASAASTSRSK